MALVPWLAALDRIRTWRGTVLEGLLMSVAYVLALFHWLPSAMHSFSGVAWGVNLLVVLALAPLIAPQFIALAAARRLARGSGTLAPVPLVALAGAFAYVGIDWAMPKLMSDTLGLPLFGSAWLRQGADIAGVHGLTLLVLLVNECVLAVARGVRSRPAGTRPYLAPTACLVALLAVPAGYGALRIQQLAEHDSAAKPVTVGLVQAGFSHYDRVAAELGTYLTVRTIVDTHVALSRDALERNPLDLLVWPETVYPLTFGAPQGEEGAEFDRRLVELVTRTGVPLVFGAYDGERGRAYNAAFFLQPSAAGTEGAAGAETAGVYRKTRLFPLTERVPALLDTPFVRARMPWLGTWLPGPGPRAISLNLADGRSLRVAPLICYDTGDPAQAIAAVRDGGEVILTLSNDSWFEYAHMPRLLLIISAFRSIETRRPQLRVTNTGISAVITPTGEIIDTLGLGERGVLVGSIVPAGGTTLVLRLGDWFGPASLVASGLLLGLTAIRRRRSVRSRPGAGLEGRD